MMNNKYDERRSSSRIDFIWRVFEVTDDPEELCILGYLIDINDSGAKLFFNTEWNLNEKKKIRITFEKIDKSLSDLIIDAQLIWKKQSKKNNMFEGGIRFSPPENEQKEKLTTLISFIYGINKKYE